MVLHAYRLSLPGERNNSSCFSRNSCGLLPVENKIKQAV